MSISPATIIEKVEEILSEDNNREKMHAFLEKFFQCEVYVRPILRQYYCDIGEEKQDAEIALISKDIKDACEESGIYFEDKKLITRIFGAADEVDKSSCRWLRNKITHELMRRAVKEACTRSDELISDMNQFIEQIKEQQ